MSYPITPYVSLDFEYDSFLIGHDCEGYPVFDIPSMEVAYVSGDEHDRQVRKSTSTFTIPTELHLERFQATVFSKRRRTIAFKSIRGLSSTLDLPEDNSRWSERFLFDHGLVYRPEEHHKATIQRWLFEFDEHYGKQVKFWDSQYTWKNFERLLEHPELGELEYKIYLPNPEKVYGLVVWEGNRRFVVTIAPNSRVRYWGFEYKGVFATNIEGLYRGLEDAGKLSSHEGD